MRIKMVVETLSDDGHRMDVYHLAPEAYSLLLRPGTQGVVPVRTLRRVREGWTVMEYDDNGNLIDDGTAYPERTQDNAVAAAIKFGAK